MLQLNDFKEKKILHVGNRPGLDNKLKFRNSNICLYRDDKFTHQVSTHLIFAIYYIGELSLTSVLIKQMREHGISLFLLNDSLKTYAEITSAAEGNYILRKKQYHHNDSFALEISRNLVLNKVQNQYNALQKTRTGIVITDIASINGITNAKSTESMLGFEGNAAKGYFNRMFDNLKWYRRTPRTKEDIPNLLLDIGYTYLFNYVDSLLRLFGFDTYMGYYHKPFFIRKSLSCDVMEPLRPIIDYKLVKAWNLGQINEKDFYFKDGEFLIKKDFHRKYTNMFFEELMRNREDIYTYIKNFYKHIMDPNRYHFKQYLYK